MPEVVCATISPSSARAVADRRRFIHISCVTYQRDGVSYDVNRRAAYAMKELALGRDGMTKFCDIFDMSPPSNGKSWSLHHRSITETGKTVLREHLLQAGQRLCEFHRAGDPSLGETSTIDIPRWRCGLLY